MAGCTFAGQRSDSLGPYGDAAPAQEPLSLLPDDTLYGLLASLPLRLFRWKEGNTHPVVALRGQLDSRTRGLPGKELVGHLDQDARPVAGLRVRPRCAPVPQV